VRELTRDAQYGWTMQRQADLEKKITSLTAAQLNAAVRKYVDPAGISYFKAGDFKKAGITQ
jgi:zinc protease